MMLQVLAKLMNEELQGKNFEALVSLASQIGKVLPQQFAHQLELQHDRLPNLVKKLVDALNSSKKPIVEHPRMRRVIIEMTICILESCPRYAEVFREKRMMEALSIVERTPSKVEKYRVFSGNVGVIPERGLPLPVLVAKAKGLVAPATQTA
jgi:hypothetical protein